MVGVMFSLINAVGEGVTPPLQRLNGKGGGMGKGPGAPAPDNQRVVSYSER